MPRKPFLHNPNYPYHLSARSNNKDWFTLDLPEVWEIMSRYLYLMHHEFGVRIHSFVLMDNHFHLLATFPEGNLSAAMQYFMRETSRCMAQQSGRINHVYGGRHFRSAITRPHYFLHAYKYVYRNPVEAGLCLWPEIYPFSTLAGLVGFRHLLVPVFDDVLFEDVEAKLVWLRQAPAQEHREAVRRALRGSQFKLALDKHSRRPHALEVSTY